MLGKTIIGSPMRSGGMSVAAGRGLARRSLMLLIAMLTSAQSVAAPAPAPPGPHITTIDVESADRIAIQGRDFGRACAQCEVVADYEYGPKIALMVEDWRDHTIIARQPDLNAGDTAHLQVRAAGGTSLPAAVHLRIETEKRLLVHQRSARKVGDKGELSVAVSQAPARCAHRSPVFAGAELRVRARRFGEAEIV
ncbi:MAG: hypothetical protein KC731_03105, partial [Myxococcales bacterium]|nr:hypothetical protein [Myxococcales bacterium]